MEAVMHTESTQIPLLNANTTLEIDEIKKENDSSYPVLCSLQANIFREKCRVCLENIKTDFLNIFDKDTETADLIPELCIADKINMCAQIIQIHMDDYFSQIICCECKSMLDNAYRFKILCENSDRTMRLKVSDPLGVEIQQIKCEPFTIEDENMIKSEYEETSLPEPDDMEPMDEPELPKIEITDKESKKLKINSNVSKKKFQCEECGHVCGSASHLKSHKSTRHQVETPFPCPNCPKEFKNKYLLAAHHNTTHLVDPIVCDSCGKTFKNSSLLSSHVRTVHKRGNKKTLTCSYCEFRTNKNSALKRHESIHTERSHHCTMCEKSFHNASYLSRHIRDRHDRLNPHKCDQCGKGFVTPDKLRQHNVTHTGLKPFVCPHCTTSTYRWYKGLELHVKSHHPNESIQTEAKMYKEFMASYNATSTTN